MQNHLEGLIKLLLDKKASIADRDDAAMDLFEYDDATALNALLNVARNKYEDPIILNSCGESVASIWVRKNMFNKTCYESLSKEAQDGIYNVIKTDKPEWLTLFDL